MPRLSHPATDNWCVVVEFPSYEDATAFRQLIEGLNPVSLAVRPKNQHPSNGNVATWRLTTALREQLSGNSFTREDCMAAAQIAGYQKSTALGWLTNATALGLLQRLDKGVYEFVGSNLDTLVFHDPECLNCRPEPLVCPAP